jgi:hypothetical protein
MVGGLFRGQVVIMNQGVGFRASGLIRVFDATTAASGAVASSPPSSRIPFGLMGGSNHPDRCAGPSLAPA